MPVAIRAILQALRGALATRQAGGSIMGGLNVGSLLSKVLNVLGLVSIADLLIATGGDQNESEMLEDFMKVVDIMIAQGMVHSWTSRNPEDIGPKYFILNLEEGSGFFTNFHMSRSGLSRHDEKQDTYKRPARAARKPSGSKKR